MESITAEKIKHCVAAFKDELPSSCDGVEEQGCDCGVGPFFPFFFLSSRMCFLCKRSKVNVGGSPLRHHWVSLVSLCAPSLAHPIHLWLCLGHTATTLCCMPLILLLLLFLLFAATRVCRFCSSNLHTPVLCFCPSLINLSMPVSRLCCGICFALLRFPIRLPQSFRWPASVLRHVACCCRERRVHHSLLLAFCGTVCCCAFLFSLVGAAGAQLCGHPSISPKKGLRGSHEIIRQVLGPMPERCFSLHIEQAACLSIAPQTFNDGHDCMKRCCGVMVNVK